MAMKIDGPVEFECFVEDATFVTFSFTIHSEDGRIKLESEDCPHCDTGGHWKEETY